MTQIMARFVEFRLRYRLPIVSDIEMHNEFYAGLRRSLRLDQLAEKLAHDTAEYHQFILQQIEEAADSRRRVKRERRQASARQDAFFSAFIIFGLTFLAFSSLGEKLSRVWKQIIGGETGQTDSPWIGLIAGLVAGLVGGYVHYRKERRNAEDDDAEDNQEDRTRDAAVDIGGDADTNLTVQAAAVGAARGHGQAPGGTS